MTRGDPGTLAAALRARLAEHGTPRRAAGEQRYLKSSLTHLGVATPELRRETHRLLREHDLDLAGRVALVTALWKEPVHELRRAGVEILVDSAAQLDASHLALVERLLREARTWALVDPLAINVAGAVVACDPGAQATLDRWITDDDFWIRRSALLAHLPSLRADPSRFAAFATHADRVLDEREFFVRKAIGWVLREVARRTPRAVVGWLAPRTQRASGVTIREAIKHLPEADAARLMAAYRARRPAAPADGPATSPCS